MSWASSSSCCQRLIPEQARGKAIEEGANADVINAMQSEPCSRMNFGLEAGPIHRGPRYRLAARGWMRRRFFEGSALQLGSERSSIERRRARTDAHASSLHREKHCPIKLVHSGEPVGRDAQSSAWSIEVRLTMLRGRHGRSAKCLLLQRWRSDRNRRRSGANCGSLGRMSMCTRDEPTPPDIAPMSSRRDQLIWRGLFSAVSS
jgi:hypothetical protein